MPNSDLTFSKKSVTTLLTDNDAEFYGKKNGKDIYIYDDYIVIQLPENNNRIKYEVLEEIVLEQLELSDWEFDYWIGEQS